MKTRIFAAPAVKGLINPENATSWNLNFHLLEIVFRLRGAQTDQFDWVKKNHNLLYV